MAASRSGATLSAMTWPGSRPIAASRASRAFRALPPSPWSRPRWSGAARRPSRADIIFLRLFWMLCPSLVRFAPIGALRTACTGSWTWSSTTTSLACAPATAPRTCPSSDTWPSHGPEPRGTDHANHKPQKPPQARRMGPKLPRNPHPPDSLKSFKRFPWGLDATVITLRAKRDQIEGLIAHLEGRLKEARTDLAHVNATLNKAGL